MARKYITDTTWVIATKIINIIGALALIRLLTEFLSPIQYGHLALALTGFGFLTQMLMGPLGQAIGRYYSHSIHTGGLFDFSYAAIRYVKKAAYVLMVFCMVSIVLLNWIGEESNVKKVVLICVYSYIFGVNDLINGMQNLARNRKEWFANVAIETSLKLILVLFLLSYFDQSPEIVLLALILSSLLALAHQSLNISKLNKNSTNEGTNKTDWNFEILSFARKAALWGPVVWLQQSSDRWSLQHFSGSNEVGLYAALYQISYAPMVLVGGTIGAILVPYLYNQNSDLARRYKSIFWYLLGLTALAAYLADLFLVKLFLPLIVSKEFYPIAQFIPLMIIAGGLWAAGDVLIITLLGQMKSEMVLHIKIISSLLGLLANVICAFLFGLIGVVYAQMIFCTFYAVLSYYKLVMCREDLSY
ncbi:oligosaccharide flippase family protein [Polynucleobacter sp. MWH-Loch1C5]|uniref:lipopolysaccharide biosynthesis protein n=1 Tax=Polynucleobacter sp. MWH-Loch1C5 TaxID=2689108 RepID=UPI001C0D0CBA|nr:oligosaccharide flippase family protein [Polynucleobacter sp. MWH-Loch1C5]MBU3542212.1 oligosaccharide flippase family protein [Polynucleobacter sp. MWH-Loch1C5]